MNEYLSKRNNLPLKSRFKSQTIRELTLLLMSQNQLIFQRNVHFLSLCSSDRTLLVHRVTKYISLITFSLIIHITHLIDDLSFYKTLETLFQSTSMFSTNPIFTRLDQFDVLFLKLSLTIICFSTFDYVIYENQSANHLLHLQHVTEIQNLYIDLAWRYLVYEYNEQQARRYFFNLVQYLFTVNATIVSMYDGESFQEMMQLIIQRTNAAIHQ